MESHPFPRGNCGTFAACRLEIMRDAGAFAPFGTASGCHEYD